MDMKIAGSGQITQGQYDTISISGSGKLDGAVYCINFSAAGSANGDTITCEETFKASGSCHFTGSVTAKNFSAAGSASCGGNIYISEKLEVGGSFSCNGNIHCHTLSAGGGIQAEGDIEAEFIDFRGKLCCGGLLNAEDITIHSREHSKIGSIGGSRIVINRDSRPSETLLSLLFKRKTYGYTTVESSVEGDRISLCYTEADRVSGRIVTIGEGCKINLVQYSEEIKISPNAEVQKTEKI